MFSSLFFILFSFLSLSLPRVWLTVSCHTSSQLKFHTLGNWTRHTHCTSTPSSSTTLTNINTVTPARSVQMASAFTLSANRHVHKAGAQVLYKYCMKIFAACKCVNVLKWWKHFVDERHILIHSSFTSLKCLKSSGLKNSWRKRTLLYRHSLP